MQARIQHPDPSLEFFFDEGCYILEVGNSVADPACSIARARVAPGNTTRWHQLEGVTERYLIIAGQGRVEVGDLAPQTVCPGDLVIIPARMRQRITNLGNEDLVFYAICTPRFTPECYRDVEEIAGSGD